MTVEQTAAKLRELRKESGLPAVPTELQGVSKEKIRNVLDLIGVDAKADIIDCVFALLDNETSSWFSNAAKLKFCDGATTAHLGCHIGIFQRQSGKMDREGRDYWIKPLRDLEAVEPILLHDGAFLIGHAKAKSPNSAYRLHEDFKKILVASEADIEMLVAQWGKDDAVRARSLFHAEALAASKKLVDQGHSGLIKASAEIYAPKFLPGFEVIYIDDGDGDRISDEDKKKLKEAGLELLLSDAMPDVLLWNRTTNWLWVIEAVTSDGEVDLHKVKQVETLAFRNHKVGVGFTTTYRNWNDAAKRQEKQNNLAVGTYMWIQSNPSKHHVVMTYPKNANELIGLLPSNPPQVN